MTDLPEHVAAGLNDAARSRLGVVASRVQQLQQRGMPANQIPAMIQQELEMTPGMVPLQNAYALYNYLKKHPPVPPPSPDTSVVGMAKQVVQQDAAKRAQALAQTMPMGAPPMPAGLPMPMPTAPGPQMAPAPQGPVANARHGGLADLDAHNIGNEEHYARGGIVAFQEGGASLEDPATPDLSYLTPYSPYPDVAIEGAAKELFRPLSNVVAQGPLSVSLENKRNKDWETLPYNERARYRAQAAAQAPAFNPAVEFARGVADNSAFAQAVSNIPKSYTGLDFSDPTKAGVSTRRAILGPGFEVAKGAITDIVRPVVPAARFLGGFTGLSNLWGPGAPVAEPVAAPSEQPAAPVEPAFDPYEQIAKYSQQGRLGGVSLREGLGSLGGSPGLTAEDIALVKRLYPDMTVPEIAEFINKYRQHMRESGVTAEQEEVKKGYGRTQKMLDELAAKAPSMAMGKAAMAALEYGRPQYGKLGFLGAAMGTYGETLGALRQENVKNNAELNRTRAEGLRALQQGEMDVFKSALAEHSGFLREKMQNQRDQASLLGNLARDRAMLARQDYQLKLQEQLQKPGQALEDLRQQMLEVLRDRTLTPEQRDQVMAVLQRQAEVLSSGTPSLMAAQLKANQAGQNSMARVPLEAALSEAVQSGNPAKIAEATRNLRDFDAALRRATESEPTVERPY